MQEWPQVKTITDYPCIFVYSDPNSTARIVEIHFYREKAAFIFCPVETVNYIIAYIASVYYQISVIIFCIYQIKA